MELVEKLELNRLIKELDFIDSDLVYKSSLLKVVDENFVKCVNNVLDGFPQLKEMIDKKNQERLDKANQQNTIPIEIELPIEEVITESKPVKIKNLYRQIAKSTHPDKNDQENLRELYLEAQKAYDSNDLVQIITICERLKIEYEITREEFQMIRDEIEFKRRRINFLESTYTWKWYQENSEDQKNKIILTYLESQISK
jgi:hypothetical protein